MLSYVNAYSDIVNEDSKVNKNNVKMEFTNNIAAEFTNTMNEFTSVCAKMVEARVVDKELYDKFDNLMSKLKNLVDSVKQ